ncbi:MAG TPA: hypothetical protein VFE16_00860 [Candidatus Cybelea sp.]|jgi:hypothetical protein|nr:hypothetical protein [Candidatus Cybelea sp.]
MNQRPFALMLAITLIAAAPPQKAAGFVDLAQLVAIHPLHNVLLAYDREIAALQSTQHLGGLSPATAAERASAAVRRDASAAQTRTGEIASRDQQADRSRERAAVATILSSQRTGDRDMGRYAASLTRETNANFTNYGASIAERNDRAYAAREQQLREKENTLAFDLARRDAAKRLSLRLKLGDLHLTHPARARYAAELRALDDEELRAISALRRSDAAVLAAYGRGLASSGNADQGAMAVQLRGAAVANLAIRRRVAQAGAQTTATSPGLRAAAASFAPSYRLDAEAQNVTRGFHAAGDELSHRFAQLADSANQSQRETAAAIGRLEATRAQLYRSIVAQIVNEARLVARRRGLDNVEVGRSRPAGSVDLTRAVRAGLATR